MQKADSAQGSCLCGAIRFTFDFPSKWCAHCYCSMCRKAHGAGLVTWIGVPEGQFRLKSGKAQLLHYGSSPGATRSYCAACGSSLFFQSEKWPGEIHIAMGCLDTPADREPEGNVFTDNKAHWVPQLDVNPGSENK